MKRTAVVGSLLAATLLVAGCAGPDEAAPAAQSSDTSSDTSSAAEGSAEASGPTVSYDFTARTLAGDTFDGEQLAGKPAVLWFWAPWCPTCRAQSSGVSALAEKYDGQVNVVGVGALDDLAAIEEYAATVDGPTHLVDPEGEVWRHFGVTAQSTYVVVDADGRLVADGYLDDAVLADEVAGLVG